jgi:hypothetical protein
MRGPPDTDGSRGPIDASFDDVGEDGDASSEGSGTLDERFEGDAGRDATEIDASADDASRDAAVPDVAVPDVVLPDAPGPDVVLPDALDPDVALPDATTCPSSLRAPVVCLDADASTPAAVIESCPTASRTLFQENQIVGSLRADGQGVYWRGGSDLGLHVLRSGAATPEVLGFMGPYPFVIDDSALYYPTSEYTALPPPGSRVDIMKMKRDGTGLTYLAAATPGSVLALGGDRLYFNSQPDSLNSVPKAGGAVESVFTGHPVKEVVADATDVYWSETTSEASTNGPSAIWRAPHGSTAPTLVATGIRVCGLWEEGSSLIVLSQEETPAGDLVASYLLEIGKGGGDCPRVLAYLPASLYPQRITTLVADSRAIYWTASAVDHTEYSVWYAPRAGGIAVKASAALSDDCLALTPSQVLWADRRPALRTFSTSIELMDRP